MINLLPLEHKQEIRAGRTNVLLVRYIAIILCAAVILCGLIGGVYLVLNTAKQNAEAKAAENAQRLVAYQDIRTRADAFRTDLATAKSILDNRTSFTKLIYGISAAIPKNVVIDTLTLDPATFGSPMSINAKAKTFDDVSKLRDSLSANTDIFTSVQVVSIRGSGNGPTPADPYPIEIVLSVVIKKGAGQ